MPSLLKGIAKSTLAFLGLRVGQSFSPGLALAGYSVFKDPHPAPKAFHSSLALQHALKRSPGRALDVGSGGGTHASAFAQQGWDVLCVDYMTSVYAAAHSDTSLNIFRGDFLQYTPQQPHDLVWASHVLEHQRNVGVFIEHLLHCCRADGWIYITVPDPHHQVWGGHVSVWSPGLLAYNAALCSVDLSCSACLRGIEEFTLVFRNRRAALPALSFDKGDVVKLGPLLPPEIQENASGWVYWDHLNGAT